MDIKPSLFIFFIYLSFSLAGRTFYVSNAGDDSRNITEAQSINTPWKTIAKLNTYESTWLPGDTILFCKGDIFYGRLQISSSGNASNPIVIDSYVCNSNNANKPAEIIGAVNLNSATWGLSGSIYSANIGSLLTSSNATSISHFVIGENFYLLARFPNANQGQQSYLFVQSTLNNKTNVGHSNLTQSAGYWVGGNLRVRTSDWTYEIRTVSESGPGSINVSSPLSYTFLIGWGFYIDNIYGELDAQGEFFFNNSTKVVSFIPINGTAISTIIANDVIYGVSVDAGIVIASGKNFITVRNLKLSKFKTYGIWVRSGNNQNISIENVQVSEIGLDGIKFDSDIGSRISNCNVRNAHASGIHMGYPRNSLITNNTITNIGVIPGYGFSGVNGAIGILIDGGTGTTLQYNYLQYVGYIGIRFDGSGHLLDRNILLDSMMTMADGGHIYCWGPGAANSTVSNNIGIRSYGGMESTNHYPGGIADGIYLDDNSNGHTVVNNTMLFMNREGIFLHNSNFNYVSNNFVYGASGVALLIGNDRLAANGQCRNNSILQNQLFTYSRTLLLFSLTTGYDNFDFFTTCRDNYYCNPRSPITHNRNGTLTLQGFQSASGWDSNSRLCGLNDRADSWAILGTPVNLYTNFTVSRGNWFCNTVPGSGYCGAIAVTSAVDPDCTSSLGCLQLLNTNFSTQNKILGIPVLAGKTYRITCRIHVNTTITMDAVLSKDSSPYNGYGTLGTRVYTPGYYNFTMFANPPVNGTSLFQFNIRPNAVGETNKFLASDFVMTEFQDIDNIYSFYNPSWAPITIPSAGMSDAEGNLIRTNLTLAPLKAIILFQGDCRRTISCNGYPCNQTNGLCMFPPDITTGTVTTGLGGFGTCFNDTDCPDQSHCSNFNCFCNDGYSLDNGNCVDAESSAGKLINHYILMLVIVSLFIYH